MWSHFYLHIHKRFPTLCAFVLYSFKQVFQFTPDHQSWYYKNMIRNILIFSAFVYFTNALSCQPCGYGPCEVSSFMLFFPIDKLDIRVLFLQKQLCSAVFRLGSRVQLHPQIFGQKKKNTDFWPKKKFWFNMLHPQS